VTAAVTSARVRPVVDQPIQVPESEDCRSERQQRETDFGKEDAPRRLPLPRRAGVRAELVLLDRLVQLGDGLGGSDEQTGGNPPRLDHVGEYPVLRGGVDAHAGEILQS
jgi:hypothetical protein